jgi:hypothetical protein
MAANHGAHHLIGVMAAAAEEQLSRHEVDAGALRRRPGDTVIVLSSGRGDTVLSR